MTTTETGGLDLLAKPNQKLTLIVPGGGMMGCDSRTLIMTKGTSQGRPLYAEPRGRKKYYMDRILSAGAILLKGHVNKEILPIFEGDVPYRDKRGFSVTSMILDGVGGRFVDAAGDGGKTLLTSLKELLLFHTMSPTRKMVLRALRTGDQRSEGEVIDACFEVAFATAMGPPVSMEPVAPAPPARKSLFTDAMKANLLARRSAEEAIPQYRLFLPDSECTWLVCSMEEDGDTLWVVADIGAGVVEYGTQSLEELETATSSRFKMRVERDLHWRGTDKTMSEILSLSSLQAGAV
jgi:hypothetical protein